MKTPDSDFDHMVNVWNAYNALITYAWSRAASLIYNGERDGLGYRDTVQDFLGVTPLLKEKMRDRLELAWALTVLGFPPGSERPTNKEITRSYRTRMRAVHPDHGGDRATASKEILDLNAALPRIDKLLQRRLIRNEIRHPNPEVISRRCDGG